MSADSTVIAGNGIRAYQSMADVGERFGVKIWYQPILLRSIVYAALVVADPKKIVVIEQRGVDGIWAQTVGCAYMVEYFVGFRVEEVDSLTVCSDCKNPIFCDG